MSSEPGEKAALTDPSREKQAEGQGCTLCQCVLITSGTVLVVLFGVLAFSYFFGENSVCNSEAPPPYVLGVLQWTPHWECMAETTGCKHEVETDLTDLLLNSNMDFANVVQQEDDLYVPPYGWRSFSKSCGEDVTTLYYDSTKWSPMNDEQKEGCFADGNEFVLHEFISKKGCFRVVVVGAHFPPSSVDYAPLPATLQEVMKDDTSSVIVLADTMQPSSTSSSDIMCTLGISNCINTVSSKLINTCCSPTFTHPYDRIMASFGNSLDVSVIYDTAPAPAATPSANDTASTTAPAPFAKDFHKGIYGALVWGSGKPVNVSYAWKVV